MTEFVLTNEQKSFLEECALEFSDRFTDADLEYKKVYDEGIPTPPIMCPYFGRSNFRQGRNRNREGRGRYEGTRDDGSSRDSRSERGDSYSDHRYNRKRSYNDYDGQYNRDSNNKRFKPY